VSESIVGRRKQQRSGHQTKRDTRRQITFDVVRVPAGKGRDAPGVQYVSFTPALALSIDRGRGGALDRICFSLAPAAGTTLTGGGE